MFCVLQSDDAVIGFGHTPLLHDVPPKHQANPVNPVGKTPTVRITLAVGEPRPIVALDAQLADMRTIDAAATAFFISQRSSLCGSLRATTQQLAVDDRRLPACRRRWPVVCR